MAVLFLKKMVCTKSRNSMGERITIPQYFLTLMCDPMNRVSAREGVVCEHNHSYTYALSYLLAQGRCKQRVEKERRDENQNYFDDARTLHPKKWLRMLKKTGYDTGRSRINILNWYPGYKYIIFPDQEKPEFLVRQRIFSYATYFEAKPRCTLHS